VNIPLGVLMFSDWPADIPGGMEALMVWYCGCWTGIAVAMGKFCGALLYVGAAY